MEFAGERIYRTPLSNSSLLPLLLLSLARQRHSPDGLDAFKKEYDYIIVGAGAAGSVVASRLSELPFVSVLLLEAGHKPPLLTEVPALGKYFWGSDINWGYKSVPQKYSAFGYVNRELPWETGKMIGGSSALNSMLYVRGNRRDYDEWEEMGATGWSYNDVFPYFLKLEDNTDLEFLSNGYHSVGGPLTAERPRYKPKLKNSMYEAISEMGYQIVDSNAARQTGFYDHQATIRNNQRCSAAKAYLVPAENRTNLDIVSEAMVTKILIQNGEAYGVKFEFRGSRFEVKARREVIVSAGAVNTPKLLKLSGIGPANELQALNIPVIADLPVGNNFVNHAIVQMPFIIGTQEPELNKKLSDRANIYEFINYRSGPLASNDGFFFSSFLKGDEINPSVDIPNYAIYMGESSILFKKSGALNREVYEQYYGPYENQTLYECTVSILQPKSRGTITLRSKDPYDPPLIEPNYLADPRDLEDILQGLKTCLKIVKTRAFRNIGAMPFQTLVPGCERLALDEDKYLRCYIRVLLLSFHHNAGTARMGDPSDSTTVVDPQLRVKNVSHLRVVDASVMPVITSGNTYTPTIMIAEKASDIIKNAVVFEQDKKVPVVGWIPRRQLAPPLIPIKK